MGPHDSSPCVARVKRALRAGYWPTCLTEGHMVVNDHTRSAENWKCVWYLLRLYIYIYIYRVYVDSHSLGQLALASKRTASIDILAPASFLFFIFYVITCIYFY